MKRTMITGSLGQIGSELMVSLREKFGNDQIVATDIRNANEDQLSQGPFEILDTTNLDSIQSIIKKYNIGTVYHLASILSANAEKDPQFAWHVNMDSLFNILEAGRLLNLSLFVPSSIAAFGPTSPKDMTPQDTIQRPTSMYGVTKVSGELLCDYYFLKYGVDVRGVRYPGLISYKTPPGGGTTDYAVEIFYEAVKHKKYTCFLGPNTSLDMMYMADAIKGSIQLMDASPSMLIHRNAFNISAMSFTPETLTKSIKKIIPEFEITYDIDPVRQGIADSWPNSMDDSSAREEWGWKPSFDLDTMVKDMIEKLTEKLSK